jgi:DNA-binding phage protein
MPLTRNFTETIKERAKRDANFRVGLLTESVSAFFHGDVAVGKALLRDYVNATIGFEKLAADIGKNPKSLMRMLSDKGNPRIDNLFSILALLQKKEGVSLNISA